MLKSCESNNFVKKCIKNYSGASICYDADDHVIFHLRHRWHATFWGHRTRSWSGTQPAQPFPKRVWRIFNAFSMFHWWGMAWYHDGSQFRETMWPSSLSTEWNNEWNFTPGEDLRKHTCCLWLLHFLHLSLQFYHVEHCCCCHHGQFWLFDPGLLHSRLSSSWRIHHRLVRIWSTWRVSLFHFLSILTPEMLFTVFS